MAWTVSTPMTRRTAGPAATATRAPGGGRGGSGGARLLTVHGGRCDLPPRLRRQARRLTAIQGEVGLHGNRHQAMRHAEGRGLIHIAGFPWLRATLLMPRAAIDLEPHDAHGVRSG